MTGRHQHLFAVFGLGLVVLLMHPSARAEQGPAPTAKVSYFEHIRPIFQAKCQGCHQPAKPLGEFVMTSFQHLVAGGESGDAAIVPGKADESYLVEQITPVDGEASMPKNGEPLHETQIELIRKWIEQGALDDTPESAKVAYSHDNPPKYVRPPVITSLDYSPDGKLLAVSGFNEVLLHYTEGKDNTLAKRLIGMSERIESVRFSPDGNQLAVCGGSPGRAGEVQIWDVASGELQLSLPVTFDTVYGASWSPDGDLLAFGCADSTVRAIDVSTGEQVLYQGSHNDRVFETVFSKDGSHLVSVGDDMTAKLIEVKTQRFIDNITSITPKALKGGINSVVRHPNRDDVLFGGADGVPKIYQMHRTTARKIGDDANQLWELPPLPGRIFSVAYSRDASRIAAGSSLDGEGAVHIYEIDPEYRAPKDIKAVLQKPTHTRTKDERKQLKDYFQNGIQVLGRVELDSGVYAVSFTPDGKQVAAAGSDGVIRLLNAEDGSIQGSFVPVEITSGDDEGSDERRIVTQPPPTLQRRPLPPGSEVANILVQPADIILTGRNEYAQILVTAKLTSGDLVDVTRICDLQIDGEAAAVTDTGVVTPLADGDARLVATLKGHMSVGFITSSNVSNWKAPDYVRDVMPVVSRLGCNAGTCHGSKDGRNGFKLSLRGYDPIYDVRAFTDDIASRRVNLASPDNSLMLLKCTGAVPHEGGQVTPRDSKYYHILRDWIANGAKLNLDSSRVTGIEVFPVDPVVQQIGGRQQMRVVASYADGARRDVTQEAFIESGNTDIVKPVMGHAGLTEVLRRGEAPLLVRFEGRYAATTITVMGDRTGFQWKEPPKNNQIDELVAAKLKRTKTLPSGLCDDYAFVRRVYLDLTGLPPTADQVRDFVDDKTDSRWKRDMLIDRLVGSDAYVDHWTNKWADLLQVNRKFLGAEGAAAFRQWIYDKVQNNVRYDQFVREVLTATGSNADNPAASYFKILRTPDAIMENTTHLFLATRFNCNKCHDHPFERWTQDQYYEMAAFFAQVQLVKDERSGDKQIGRTAVEPGKPLFEIVSDEGDGEVTHERTGVVTAPAVPYDATANWTEDQTHRERLAQWMTSPDNQYFAKSYVNRLWGYLTGTGIIEPLDDIRAGNPPTNPDLLDWLTEQFIESEFNTQQLVKTICKSRTYQLSIDTNQWNHDDEINFSHAKARRLPAEVLYDAIHVVTGAQSRFPDVPAGTRAAALPDVGIKLPDGFLGNLGRPARESACECERSNDLQLGPVMALVSGPTVGEALASSENALSELVRSTPDDHRLFDELFLRILNRPARQDEIRAAVETMDVMQEEHTIMGTRLAKLEREWKPMEAELEAQRWAKIAAAERALNGYLDETREAREAATQAREDKIAGAETALATYESELSRHLAEWEKSETRATEWKTLELSAMKATFGADLEKLSDESVFASGKNGRGNYDLDAEFFGDALTGIRIEALTDERLPKHGPGRADDGNFVISEFKVQWADPSQHKEVEIGKWTYDLQPGFQQQLDPESAKGRLFLLEVHARLTGETQSQVFWSTAEHDSFEESRSVKLTLSGQGQWLPYRYYFRSQDDLTGLKFRSENDAEDVQVQRARLVRIEDAPFQDVPLLDAQADFSQKNYAVATAIDGKNDDINNGWAVSPETGKSHQAIFALKDPISSDLGAKLKLTLMQNHRGNKYSLGRFRISVTSSPGILDFGLPEDVSRILSIAESDRTEDQRERLMAYFREFGQQIRSLQREVVAAQEPLPEDPQLKQLEAAVADATQPIRIDPTLVRTRAAVAASREQLKNKRLTAAQDVAWALINNPAFLFNH